MHKHDYNSEKLFLSKIFQNFKVLQGRVFRLFNKNERKRFVIPPLQ